MSFQHFIDSRESELPILHDRFPRDHRVASADRAAVQPSLDRTLRPNLEYDLLEMTDRAFDWENRVQRAIRATRIVSCRACISARGTCTDLDAISIGRPETAADAARDCAQAVRLYGTEVGGDATDGSCSKVRRT